MKKRSLIAAILVLAILAIALGYVYSENVKKIPTENNTQIANPASIYCISHGGNISLREDEFGGQYGVCVLSNGTECEEWKFFRGECNLVQNNLNCSVDADCVPASCCHATSCVTKQEAPLCKGVACTMMCQPGSLDCNQGSCACVNNKCSALIK